jgi:hypothetical protein
MEIGVDGYPQVAAKLVAVEYGQLGAHVIIQHLQMVGSHVLESVC